MNILSIKMYDLLIGMYILFQVDIFVDRNVFNALLSSYKILCYRLALVQNFQIEELACHRLT